MKLVLFSVFFLIGFSLFGQRVNHKSISLSFQSGFLVAHRAQMSHLIKDLNKGGEIEFSQQRKIPNSSAKLFRWPLQGLTVSLQDFGYREVLGQAYGITQFTDFRIFEHEKIGFFDFRLAAGLAFITKDFHPTLNYKNNAIGSHLNALVNIQLHWQYYLEKINFGIGLGIRHYSNAAINAPNLGLNTPLVHLKLGYHGVKREFFEINSTKKSELISEERLKKNFQVGVLTTVKQNLPGSSASRFLPVFGLQGTYILQINKRWDLECVFDFVYNQANRLFYDNLSFSFWQTLQPGISLGSALNIFDAQIYFGLGGYLYNEINPAGYIYNRIGYRKKIGKNENWRLYCGIKAHFGRADYLETGLAYAF